MAGEPIGIGEEKNKPNGNSVLTTIAPNGREIHTPLWIAQFSTDLNLQIDSAQVRKGLMHRPIRFAERHLTFTSLWNVANRQDYLDLGEKIRHHWAYNFNQNRPTPMVFKYFGASKAWKGYIENWETAFAITDVVLAYNFSMRLITSLQNEPAFSDTVSSKTVPFAPTSQQIEDFGSDWYTGKYFESLPNSATKKGKPPKKATSGNPSSEKTGPSASSVESSSDDNGADSSAQPGDQFGYEYWRIIWKDEQGPGYFDR